MKLLLPYFRICAIIYKINIYKILEQLKRFLDSDVGLDVRIEKEGLPNWVMALKIKNVA